MQRRIFLMFKIFCVICFTQIGSLSNTLCFPSSIPIEYKTLEQCNLEKDKIIAYMHKDLVDRETSIMFVCKENLGNKINI